MAVEPHAHVKRSSCLIFAFPRSPPPSRTERIGSAWARNREKILPDSRLSRKMPPRLRSFLHTLPRFHEPWKAGGRGTIAAACRHGVQRPATEAVVRSLRVETGNLLATRRRAENSLNAHLFREQAGPTS